MAGISPPDLTAWSVDESLEIEHDERGVESDRAEHERQHRSHQGPHHHDAEDRQRDDEGGGGGLDLIAALSVVNVVIVGVGLSMALRLGVRLHA